MRRLVLAAAAALALAVGAVGGPARATAHYEEDALLVGNATATSGSTYAFDTVRSGHPVRWNPCAPIHWRFKATGAPAGGFTQVKRAVARIASATGTTWVYDGLSTRTPTRSWLPTTSSSRPPVLIGWTTSTYSDLLRNQSSLVLGVTRTSWFGWTINGRTTASIHGAVIALNARQHLPLTGPQSWYTVALHELGHSVGLAHAGSSREIMYPVTPPGLTDLQAGDLAGLRLVGRSQGCLSV